MGEHVLQVASCLVMPVRCTCHLPPHPHRRPAPTLSPCFAQLATHSSPSSTTFSPFSPIPTTLPLSFASPRRPHPYTPTTNAHVCGRPGRVARAHEGGQAAQVSRRVQVRESQIVQARRAAHRAGWWSWRELEAPNPFESDEEGRVPAQPSARHTSRPLPHRRSLRRLHTRSELG